MLLLIDKPKGVTSHGVVDRVRKVMGIKRVGHAGTLDPNATGLLIIGVGRVSTSKLTELTKNTKKEYLAEIYLGEERDTDDVEGKVILKDEKIIPSRNDVNKVLRLFNGKIEQLPPSYSAVRVDGKRAYELSRKNKQVNLEPRKVFIYSIKLLSYEYPILELKCQVSPGTYIRAVARDIGRRLKCGAYLRNLRRTRIGKYEVNAAIRIEDLRKP